MCYRASAILCASALFLVSCGGDDAERATKDEPPALLIGGEDTAVSAQQLYQMPTPNELFSIVRELGGGGHKNALSPVQKADRFATLPGRALNFGVYATDMVYASNFRLTSEVVRYYLTCRDLGDKLGLSSTFDAGILQRLEKNLTHGDSLDVLANDAYYNAYQKLQTEQMGTTLALVLAGGWVESVHLVMAHVDAFDAASPLVARIAEQKASLEQLIDMMNTVQADPVTAPVLTRLEAIRDVYDQLAITRTSSPATSPSGRMTLGDAEQITISAEKYQELKNAVAALRDTITKAEDASAKV